MSDNAPMISFEKAKIYADMIKLAHTLFALPLALSAVALALSDGGSVSAWTCFWILAAFTAARSGAMGFNRIVDADIDAQNPRTKSRPTVSGALPMRDAKIWTSVSVLLFVFSAFMINSLCGILAFPALAVLLGYSYAKRFTCLAHYILGCALALAPIGAWIAVTGGFDARILLLGGFIFFSIAGFDQIYALQDLDFDVAHRLHSIPSRFGKNAALAFAGLSFCAAEIMLVLTGLAFDLNAAYYACIGVIAAIYIAGFSIIIKSGLKKINLVFFYMNASISILVFVATLLNVKIP